MSQIERPRFSCLLGGVLATINSLPKVIPIIHGAQGCGGNLSSSYSQGGYLGAGYCGSMAIPSSNIGESDIIFGGGERLERQIKSTYEVVDGDLFIITTTCMTDIIGDDVQGVINAYGKSEKPLLYIDAGGFLGNSYLGYSRTIETLFKSYIPAVKEKQKNLVNILGVVPGYDPFFRGDLEEIARVLKLVGLEVNTFFTNDQTIENVKNAGKANLNIVFSRVYGPDSAAKIRESHGIDFLVADLPIGALATTAFLREIGTALNLDAELVESVIRDENDSYYKYMDRTVDLYVDTDFQHYAVVIGNANGIIPYTRFLENEIGWIPKNVYVTDELAPEQQATLAERFGQLEFNERPEFVFEPNTSKIQEHFIQSRPQSSSSRYFEDFSPLYILGSTIDRDFAAAVNARLLSVSFPVINRIVVARGYAGFKGGLNLFEDLVTGLIAGR